MVNLVQRGQNLVSQGRCDVYFAIISSALFTLSESKILEFLDALLFGCLVLLYNAKFNISSNKETSFEVSFYLLLHRGDDCADL